MGPGQNQKTVTPSFPPPPRRAWPGYDPAVLRKAQRLIQMRLVEYVPNSHYGLAISLRIIGKHARDLSQGERG